MHRVAPIGLHAVADLFGNEGGRDDPALPSFLGQVAIEPVPTGAGFIDKDRVWDFGVQLAHELINVAWPSANGAEVYHFSMVNLGDISHRDGVFVDIQTDGEWDMVDLRVCR